MNIDDKPLLELTKTSFIERKLYVNSETVRRRKRKIRTGENDFGTLQNFISFKDVINYNNSDDYDMEADENRIINFRVPLDGGRPINVEMGGNKPLNIQFNLEVNEELDEVDKMQVDQLDKSSTFWKGSLQPNEVRKMQGETMIKYMDEKINPCVDFYQYACGNWAKHNSIPADRVGFDTFEELRERLDTILKELLEDENRLDEVVVEAQENFLKDTRGKRNSLATNTKSCTFKVDAITKAKYFYKSCMNEEILNKRADTPLKKLLERLGGWPVIETNWDYSKFDFIKLIGRLRLYNNDILISEWIGPDIKNSEEYIIQIDQTTLGLPTRDYFLDSSNIKYVEAYRIYMISIATLLGAPIITATKDADELISFETQLAQITASPDLRRNVSEIYNRMKVQDLESLVPQINWRRYLSIVLERKIGPNEPLVCFCVPYLHDLVDLLAITPTRTIANYLLWRFVRHRVNNLDSRFDEAKQRFYNVLFGREKSPPRWQSCVTQVNSNLGMALGSLFINKYFDETSKNDTLQMTIKLEQAFKEILDETDWLDSETKSLARDKINAMRLKIGYPDFILDKKELDSRYQDVNVHPDFYFENILSILRHLSKLEQRRLGTPVNKSIWNTAPAVVNAYYSRNKNQIMFPAGILQPPFYHKHFPRALNYGGIGVVIGHEITHGFDDKGRLFDKEGNLQKWWKEESIEKFHERTQCLIDQYNSYVVPEVNIQVDGINTQGENIADNGGIKQAFRAYQHWKFENPNVDERLPGLNISGNKLFFLNFAQVWCGISRPEATKNKLKTAVHSPGRFRVIGTLSNSQDFAEVYGCHPGSPMNPLLKCSIW